MPEIKESAVPDCSNLAASSRLPAGINSIFGKAWIACFAMGLLDISGKTIFMELL